MYLFFDTETTGLPKDYKSTPKDFELWPRMVQLGFLLCDEDRKPIEIGDYIIKPDGFEIPEQASLVHGITTEKAIENGIGIVTVLNKFFDMLDQSEYIICHNLNFDYKVILSEYYRNNMGRMSTPKKKICTMLSTVDFCKIPNPRYYGKNKWPKLNELYVKLFGNKFENEHDAFFDIKATADCFWELVDRGIIDLNCSDVKM